MTATVTSLVHHTGPRGSGEGGHLAAEIAALVGRPPGPGHQLVLDAVFAVTAAGTAATTVAVITPDRGFQAAVTEMCLLGWLFPGPRPLRILWADPSAIRQREAFTSLADRAGEHPDLRRQVKKVSRCVGEQELETVHGSRLLCRAPQGGRGYTADRLVLPDVDDLGWQGLAGLLPSLNGRPDPQVLFLAAPRPPAEGEWLTELCATGRAGADPQMAYLEWEA
jgi:hypothetical protein